MAKASIGKTLVTLGLMVGYMGATMYVGTRAITKATYDAERAELNRTQRELEARKKKIEHERIKKEKVKTMEIKRQKQLPINIIMEGVVTKVHKIRAEKELEECENELLDIIEKYHPEA